MLDAMMLENTDKRKLTLFRLLTLFSEKRYSIKFFESKLDYSYSRVVYLLELIQQDLTDMTGKKVDLLTKSGVHHKQNITYDMYYQYLITQSIPYKLLISFLYFPEDNLDRFCDKHYQSRTTVVRKSKLLIDYFKHFAIRVNISQLSLSGDERIIRILFYNLIWMTTQGTNLPKIKRNPITYDEVSKIVSPYFPDTFSYGARKQISLMLDIVYLRIRKGNILTEKTEIEPYISVPEVYTITHFGNLIKDPDALAAEAQFAAFLLIASPNFFREGEHRLLLLDSYLEEHSNSATKLLEEFTVFFRDKFMPVGFSWNNEVILFGNVANILFSHSIIQQRFPTLFHLTDNNIYSKNKYYYQLFTEFKALFQKISNRKNYAWLKTNIDALSDTLSALLVPLYESFLGNNLIRIALVAESNYLLVEPLTQFIKDIPFVQLVAYKYGEFSSFDFMVTTSSFLIPEDCPLPSFVFRFSADSDEQYLSLYQAIKDVHNQKGSNLIQQKKTNI
ncbi:MULTISPECIES: helix-turn-helix domain-containing protein [unclassified Enterococcus]|uniref:helix-turn-helix domain-containing protein n=1 Tax=unclassified Enterococcus TaxID=2608891 RepID=UPI001CE0B2D7|nr:MULTISPECIES: helix-turn-helix domain-containing protein [unclassified Enterococcus]MCA5011548.1 helix-turn-helix domain-containing protein [Enterococcus sp. S23]MCA5015010.1 helix-turn-helix domain-containing protein [Enterococcus sp. S22(2020)]